MSDPGNAAFPAPEIPNKLYFRIGEVSRLLGVKAYVLRYWETEFPALAPKKSGTGQRLYRRKDVQTLLEIKHLLYDRRYTIEGARQYLQARPKGSARKTAPARPPAQADLFGAPPPAGLREIRAQLAQILELLR
jgi:DNA-binding transcriptional MerR regulator